MKYELTDEIIEVAGRKLHRIRALVDIITPCGRPVRKGELGGWVEEEHIYKRAEVSGKAQVYNDAYIDNDAKVYGRTLICGIAHVCGVAQVFGNAKVLGEARINDQAKVYGNAKVRGSAQVYGESEVCGIADVHGDTNLCGDAWIRDNECYLTIKGLGSRYRDTTIFKTRNGDVVVRCGCFYGTLTEFVNEVGITHGDSKYAKEYLALVELAKIHFGIEK